MKLKAISILLAILMLSSSFVSCSESGNASDDTTQENVTSDSNADAVETDSMYDESGYLLDDLPDSLDFGGQQITVLYWEEIPNPEFWSEDFTGEPVNDAVHQRNINTEDDLNIKFNWIGTLGGINYEDDYMKVAQESVVAADGAYDIYAANTRGMGQCAVNSLAMPIETSEYIDFEKPWWPQSLIEEVTIGDHVYFASGDISTNLLYMMYAVYYNDRLIDEYQLQNPVDLVREGTWTNDKFIEMTEGVYRDLNGDGNHDVEDQYGFVSYRTHLDAFYGAADLKGLEKDAENLLKISDDFYSEKTFDLISKIGSFLETGDVYHSEAYDSVNMFAKGNGLFTIDNIQISSLNLRDIEFTYGVVPCPKYDEIQKDYRTVLGYEMTLYGISTDSRSEDAANAALECLASEAYRLTTPAVYENNMKKKFSNDDVDAHMFDLIRENVVFELGKYLDNYTSIVYDVRVAIHTNDNKWSSMMAKRKKLYENEFEALLEALRESASLFE